MEEQIMDKRQAIELAGRFNIMGSAENVLGLCVEVERRVKESLAEEQKKLLTE